MSQKTEHIQSFHYLKDGSLDFSGVETLRSTGTLIPGSYSVGWKGYPQDRVILSILDNFEVVRVPEFEDKEKMDALITAFFKEEVRAYFAELGFKRKVGILLHGREGTGKSSIIKHYALQLIKESDAIVFYTDEVIQLDEVWKFIQRVRQLQDNPIMLVLDELDRWTEHQEGRLKQMLDGNLSIENSVVFAATNYIDKIPVTLRNRPSRFKYVLQVEGVKDLPKVYAILSKMLRSISTEEEITAWSFDLVGNTLDEIKQFALDKVMELRTVKHKTPIGFKPTLI